MKKRKNENLEKARQSRKCDFHTGCETRQAWLGGPIFQIKYVKEYVLPLEISQSPQKHGIQPHLMYNVYDGNPQDIYWSFTLGSKRHVKNRYLSGLYRGFMEDLLRIYRGCIENSIPSFLGPIVKL